MKVHYGSTGWPYCGRVKSHVKANWKEKRVTCKKCRAAILVYPRQQVESARRELRREEKKLQRILSFWE